MRLFIWIGIGCLLAGCIKAPEYPIEPTLEFIGMSKNIMQQSDFNIDSTVVFIRFTDGDGDIGDDQELNLIVTDQRDNFISGRYRLPQVPIAGSNNGISGEIQVVLYTTCCTYPNNQPPCTPSDQFPTDTVIYEIYLLDRAGNQSNTIETDPIILQCNAPN